MTGAPPEVTVALSLTKAPHAVLVTGDPPDAIVSVVEEEVPGALMVTGSVVVAESAPETPVMVAVAEPGCAELLAVSVSVLPVDDDAGFQLAVTPGGRPVATCRGREARA